MPSLVEGRDAFRRRRGPGDLRGAQTDGAVLGRAQLPQLLLGVLHELEDLPPPGLEKAALLRQLELPAPSDQQGDPQFLFQALDLPGEGGWAMWSFSAARVMFRSWATVRK